MSDRIRAGVVGVGSMGANHARVYDELDATELAGVYDADTERAREVADRLGTEALPLDELLETAAAVSIAVPTRFHHETASECIEREVDVLVEKPFVADPAEGRDLVERAAERDVTLQVGHVERFNPVVTALQELVDDLDVFAVSAERLGPPLDRDIGDSVVTDLMIHDLDVVLDTFGGSVQSVAATGRDDGSYAVANAEFDSGVVARFAASRVTQEKVRELTISARDCRVKADFIDQTIEIHRSSSPEFVRGDGNVRHRHENVVERVTVERREPLKNELRSFVEAAATNTEPVVSGEDGLRALELTETIADEIGTDDRRALRADGGAD
ncbi:Gfo/Idh/MocA family protein [Natronoarchaeum rubrum]|uniref:Gfo/Idh/MocA family protein n=1 Tax=Natronoarchaeum rubrum TaxID=755311 RepID=UPI0021123633|nr:Gfo/Idh/MocA family oxidoreductase [Natronoarchaeum rubrum]